MRTFFAGLLTLTCVLAGSPASAATFNLIDQNGRVAGTAAEQGFRIAADYWSSVITNDVLVDVIVDYRALGANIIGSTLSNSVGFSTRSFYERLAATGTSELDRIAVANLSPLSAEGGVSMITPGYRNQVLETGVVWDRQVFDHDNTRNNKGLSINTALAKAVGYNVDNGGVDAGIVFSNAFNFDFDPTDGITTGFVDFIGVAIHEMGHMLGFDSGVDAYDDNSARQQNFQEQSVMTPLDLFRYSDDVNNLAPGNGAVLDMTPGAKAFFSIDGSTVFNGNAYFSTGRAHGDGQQASHWKDTPGSCTVQIGIMDPTFCRGQTGVMSIDDLAALDAIGWNLSVDTLARNYSVSSADVFRRFATAVPEPSTWSMLVIAFGMIGAAVRRTRAIVRPATQSA